MQSESMDDTVAAENLRVIRTLMERSALYRRALAPVSLTTGGLGLAAGAAGSVLGLGSVVGFVGFWMVTAVLVSAVSLLIVRRQALGDREAFWSPPTRRVAEAILPPLVAGLILGLVALIPGGPGRLGSLSDLAWWLPSIWMVLYGCAIHAAGFFVLRGMRRLGWIFVATGCALPVLIHPGPIGGAMPSMTGAHLVMAATFGGFHLAYGLYLALTETRNPDA